MKYHMSKKPERIDNPLITLLSVIIVACLMAIILALTVRIIRWALRPVPATVSNEIKDTSYIAHTPTGCPYGDSIPLDSPKCAPPPDLMPVKITPISMPAPTPPPAATPAQPVCPNPGK